MSILRFCALALVVTSLFLSGRATAADPPAGDLVGRVKAKIKPGQPFQMLVRIRLKPGTEEKFAAEAAKAAKGAVSEAGCESYRFYEDVEDSGNVILFEKWKNAAAFNSHIERPYTASLLKLIAEIGAEPTIQFLTPLGSQKATP